MSDRYARHRQPGGAFEVAPDPRRVRARHRAGHRVPAHRGAARRLRAARWTRSAPPAARGSTSRCRSRSEAFRYCARRSERARAARGGQHARASRARCSATTPTASGWCATCATTWHFDLQSARVLLLGAGGAAQGVIGALLEAGVAQLVDRQPHRRRRRRRSPRAFPATRGCGYEALGGESFDLDRQRHLGRPGRTRRRRCRARLFGARRARLRHGLRARDAVPRRGARRRRARQRRPRHAGRAGGRVVLRLARRAPGHRAGAARAAWR